MKIITNTKRNGKLCYVQVKDVLFLAKMTNNKRLMQDYINSINNGRVDDDFIRVFGDDYIKAFELCDYVIDFNEYSKRDIGVNYLANMIKSKAYVSPRSEQAKEGLNHQIDSIRDLIAYKRGDLDYKLPLVPNGVFESISSDQLFTFDSTVIEDCFVLSTVDGTDITLYSYESFLNSCINRVYRELYPNVSEEKRDFKYYVKGKSIVVSINRENMKEEKKNIVGRILAKIKKEK